VIVKKSARLALMRRRNMALSTLCVLGIRLRLEEIGTWEMGSWVASFPKPLGNAREKVGDEV